ncbi:Tricarboxylate/iron carrier [Entophlyctis helioformis]|nr:Tricarboxylate/iron carrier [Entophlyctis helioformis]
MTSEIDLTKPRYDQSTYWGRLRHFSEVTDPRNLLASDAQLQAAKRLVSDHISGVRAPGVTDEQLWQAKKLVDSTFHPDTGEKVLLPFRMASFVPTNVPIIAAMLLPAPGIASIVFWQWVNQSVNVAFNYFNANKTTEMSVNETAGAYAAAVASSCTIAVGLNQWLVRTKGLRPSIQSLLSRAVPFAAVASAGTLNVYLMRQKELQDGIQVQDSPSPSGVVLGSSQIAGQSAVASVAVSRIVTAAPALFIPGLIMAQLERTAWLQKRRWLTMPLNLATVAGSLLVALPCAIAIAPQMASIEVSKLEPRFRGLVDKDGRPVERVYFNRGL